VSQAIDRQGIARVVYRGRAAPLVSHDSPAGRAWHHPGLVPTASAPEASRRLLLEAGVGWREDGTLIDGEGRPVRFSILVSANNDTRRRIATLVQQDLAAVGITVDVAPFDPASLFQRVVGSLDYDAVLIELVPDDADPMAHVSTLVSGGSTHLWRLGEGQPTEEWERELDRVMREQGLSVDFERRRELYYRAQEIVARELPFVPLVSPNVLVVARAGLAGVRPSAVGEHLLWNAERLRWTQGSP
jgi:peptide/nickel transport system substrate-binding protein